MEVRVRADFVFLDNGCELFDSVEGGPGDLRLMAKQDWFVGFAGI